MSNTVIQDVHEAEYEDREVIVIEQLLTMVEEQKKKGATHVKIRNYSDGEPTFFSFYYERKETKEEEQKRIDRENDARQARERWERLQYEKLKQKFEPRTKFK